MKITYLEAECSLTKEFYIEDGELKKKSYPNVLNYTSHEEAVPDIETFHKTLVHHAALGRCLLKGNLTRQLVNEPRRGTTDANAPTRWLCFDLDGVKGVKDIKTFLKEQGLDNCDYIVQYSSSMGVDPNKGLSAHIFILLNTDYIPTLLKQWLQNKNLSVRFLKEGIQLTRTNNALRWPLDITTCQNDKLIYIAPPILGEGVRDTFKGERIQLVKRRHRVLSIDGPIPSAESNKQSAEVLLGELRKAAGLPERKRIQFRVQGEVEYMVKPDEATVTGIRKDRGFVYLNLNGGDSWGYWHAEGQTEFIYNFKGEPIYKTAELLPDYWKSCRRETFAARREGSEGRIYLAFRDFKSAAYWNGAYDRGENSLDLAQAKSKEQLGDYLRSNGQAVPEYYEDWRISFDPTTDTLVDIKAKTVNMFQPTEYMRQVHTKEDTIPPLIRKGILNALGGDEECLDHFMNWLAVILQFRCKAETSWIFSGIQGTGKGWLLNKVLKPIYGDKHVLIKNVKDIESEFNGFMEHALILFVDEVKVSAYKNKDAVNAKLKNLIVEHKLSIRRMHTNSYEAKNYVSCILVGNEGEEAEVPPNDRRFNVGVYQENKLELTDEEYGSGTKAELPQFTNYLMSYPADKRRARTALNNEAKRKMIHRNMTAIDVASKALLEGNYNFFAEQKQTIHLTKGMVSNNDMIAQAYNKLVDDMKNKDVLLREEVQLLLNYIIGGVPSSPHKFTSYAKHHKLDLKMVRYNNTTAIGMKVEWKLGNENSGD